MSTKVGRPPAGTLTTTVEYSSSDQKDSWPGEDYNPALQAPASSPND